MQVDVSHYLLAQEGDVNVRLGLSGSADDLYDTRNGINKVLSVRHA
jgi:hypothetical protein